MIPAVLRRSFVHEKLEALNAGWMPIGDSLLAATVPGAIPDAAVVLRDLSPLARTGFKAADTPSFLAERGVILPEVPNRAAGQADGSLVARLSASEFLILNRPGASGALIDHLESSWSLDLELLCFLLPRRDSHVWLHISGPQSATLFAKICGVDLRPRVFANHAIAQTSVARLSAIVIRDDMPNESLAYHLLADSASAAYLWDSLVDAMIEFSGSIAGFSSIMTQES